MKNKVKNLYRRNHSETQVITKQRSRFFYKLPAVSILSDCSICVPSIDMFICVLKVFLGFS